MGRAETPDLGGATQGPAPHLNACARRRTATARLAAPPGLESRWEAVGRANGCCLEAPPPSVSQAEVPDGNAG